MWWTWVALCICWAICCLDVKLGLALLNEEEVAFAEEEPLNYTFWTGWTWLSFILGFFIIFYLSIYHWDLLCTRRQKLGIASRWKESLFCWFSCLYSGCRVRWRYACLSLLALYPLLNSFMLCILKIHYSLEWIPFGTLIKMINAVVAVLKRKSAN